jgi:hypothetical protein
VEYTFSFGDDTWMDDQTDMYYSVIHLMRFMQRTYKNIVDEQSKKSKVD